MALRLVLAERFALDTSVLATRVSAPPPQFLSPRYAEDVAGRRFLLLVALLMGMTALAASVAPRDPALRQRSGATPTATSTPTRADPADPDVATSRLEEISADGRPARVIAEQGEQIELVVTSSRVDSVTLEALAQVEPVDPDSPARFHLLADTPGEYPIELLGAGRRVGTLIVR